VCPEKQSSALPDYYSLLEEATESWEHFLCNKIVYLDKLPQGNRDPFAGVSAVDIELNRWLQVDVTLCGERESHYLAIIRPASNGRHLDWTDQRHLNRNAVHRNPAVLVDVPEPMQSPQFSGLVSIPVMVWLKSLDNIDGFFSDSDDSLLKLRSTIAVINPDHRETGPVVRNATWGEGQRRSKMVEGSSQTGSEVPNHQVRSYRDCSDFEVQNVLSSFKIILSRDSVWLALQKLPDLFIESAEVMLRPTHLQAGAKVARGGV